MGQHKVPVLAYFFSWIGLILLAVILNALNVNWQLSHPIQGLIVVVVLTLLEASACEFLLMTVVSITCSGLGGTKKHHIERKHDHNLTLIINFNLLAHCEGDIDDAFSHMYQSFMTNLSPNVSAVLLSATGKDGLKLYELKTRDNYRALIRKTLEDEGEHMLLGETQHVNSFRLRHFWKNFMDMSEGDLRSNLKRIANRVANEFMCIHRVTRVLKKCGQYQDLFLLSEGEKLAFTYTDPVLYDSLRRKYDKPMFYECQDVNNIHNRKFDYTLVMDNDTICPAGTAHELLAVAAAHPERGIIQPAIRMDVRPTDTIYMHLEMWRQRLNEPLSRSMAILFDQWGFYGKGMINNKLYIQKMIGTRDKLIEMVPIDVLSHDTYEAAILRPLYVDTLYFEEEPSFNYITWHIRERRWNQGELILSQYFWPTIVGKPIGFLRRCFDKRNYIKTGIRTRCHFGLVSSHVAHSAVRSMFMKPLMLSYVFLQLGVHMHRPFMPLAGVLFMVCIVPKFAITTWSNSRFAAAEMFASIIQYTPEAFIGSVRLCQAIFATICKSCTENWTPQRVVEEDMRSSNPFASSIRHLWAYSTVAIACTVVFAVLIPGGNLIYFMFGTIIIIPFFTGFTSLTPNIKVIRVMSDSPDGKASKVPKPLDALMEEGKSLTSPDMMESSAKRDSPFNKNPRELDYYPAEAGPSRTRVQSKERCKDRVQSPVRIIEVDETCTQRLERGRVDALQVPRFDQKRRHRSPTRRSMNKSKNMRKEGSNYTGNLRKINLRPSGPSSRITLDQPKRVFNPGSGPELDVVRLDEQDMFPLAIEQVNPEIGLGSLQGEGIVSETDQQGQRGNPIKGFPDSTEQSRETSLSPIWNSKNTKVWPSRGIKLSPVKRGYTPIPTMEHVGPISGHSLDADVRRVEVEVDDIQDDDSSRWKGKRSPTKRKPRGADHMRKTSQTAKELSIRPTLNPTMRTYGPIPDIKHEGASNVEPFSPGTRGRRVEVESLDKFTRQRSTSKGISRTGEQLMKRILSPKSKTGHTGRTALSPIRRGARPIPDMQHMRPTEGTNRPDGSVGRRAESARDHPDHRRTQRSTTKRIFSAGEHIRNTSQSPKRIVRRGSVEPVNNASIRPPKKAFCPEPIEDLKQETRYDNDSKGRVRRRSRMRTSKVRPT